MRHIPKIVKLFPNQLKFILLDGIPDTCILPKDAEHATPLELMDVVLDSVEHHMLQVWFGNDELLNDNVRVYE